MSETLFVKYDKELKEFQEWLNSKPHIPANLGMSIYVCLPSEATYRISHLSIIKN